MTISIEQIKSLQKRYEDRKDRQSRIDTVKSIKLGEITKKLAEYQIKEVKDFPKLLAKKNEDSKKADELYNEIEKHLDETEQETLLLEKEISQ